MQRDFDLIRKLLLDVEAQPAGQVLDRPSYPEYEAASVAEHIKLLIEGGIVEGNVSEYTGGYSFYIERLTWGGHDFLQAARDDTVWKKAKEKMKSSATTISFDLLTELLKSMLRAQVGL